MRNSQHRSLISLSLCLLIFIGSSVAEEAMYHWEFAGWYGGGCYPNLTLDPKNPNRAYLVSDVAGIWKSEDLGDHWRFITKGLGNLIVSWLVITPSDSNILYAGTKRGVYLSRDAGENWEFCDRYQNTISFSRPVNYRSAVVSDPDPGLIFIGTDSGSVLKSDDFGDHWSSAGSEEKPFGHKKAITALALVDGKYLFAGSKSGLGKLNLKTQDWEQISTGSQEVFDLEWIKALPDPVLFAAGENRLFYSYDFGNTWASSNPLPRGDIRRVAAFQNQKSEISLAVVWEKGWDGGVFLSHDLGQTWLSADKNLKADTVSDPTRSWQRNGGRTTSVKIHPINPQILFRTDWWGAWRSDDGGTSWHEKIIGAANTVGSDLAISRSGSLVVATMDNGLLRSDDQGKTYQALFPGKKYDPAAAGHVWRVLISEDGKKIVGTSSPWNDRTNQIILSEDAGLTFKRVRKGLPAARPKVNTMWGEGYPRALAQDPKDLNRLYLGIDGDDGGGLFISDDAGESWSRSPGQPGSLRIYNGLVVDQKDPAILYWAGCGSQGGIYVSKDRGQTWTRVFKESQWVFDLHAAPDGSIYAAMDHSGAALYVSRNQGMKWKKIGQFSDHGSAEAVTSNPVDPQMIAVSAVDWGSGAPQKIMLSRNAGKKWEDITGDLPPGAGAAAMKFTPDGNFLVISRMAGSVYKIKIHR